MTLETASRILWGCLIFFSFFVLLSLWTFTSPERRRKGGFLTPTPFTDCLISLLVIALILWKFRSFLFPLPL